MRLGQTNGIPQGSVLMDFIAEIVLGYADTQLAEKIEEEGISQYRILRYRDDYRIFVNNPQLGEKIVKILTEVLIDLGLKLNPGKTDVSNNVVRASVKEDKLAWIAREKVAKSFQKQLLIIHSHSCNYPNSGSLVAALMGFNQRLAKRKKPLADTYQLIGVVVDIAYRNPRAYAVAAAIVSKLLSLIDDENKKIRIIKKIKAKFSKLPNTGYMEIWLQRVSIPFTDSIPYTEILCKVAEGKAKKIWNDDFISDKSLKRAISVSKIIDTDVIDSLSPVITPDEIELFIDYKI
ncbi:RNA-directed DNA polymerase [Desulfovibrio sp. OttesenSCG-928-G11]|nr:RNA-directed DNA polymerase [Desulfovibrio sp. OttesenSCG-928-G11]